MKFQKWAPGLLPVEGMVIGGMDGVKKRCVSVAGVLALVGAVHCGSSADPESAETSQKRIDDATRALENPGQQLQEVPSSLPGTTTWSLYAGEMLSLIAATPTGELAAAFVFSVDGRGIRRGFVCVVAPDLNGGCPAALAAATADLPADTAPANTAPANMALAGQVRPQAGGTLVTGNGGGSVGTDGGGTCLKRVKTNVESNPEPFEAPVDCHVGKTRHSCSSAGTGAESMDPSGQFAKVCCPHGVGGVSQEPKLVFCSANLVVPESSRGWHE
jgi:hypothetical protein